MTPQLHSMLQQAIHYFRHGNLDIAKSIIRRILWADPDCINLILGIGVSYARNNKLNEALVVFCCLQDCVEGDVRIPYNLGLIYSLQGKHQLALEAYDSALKIQPEDVEVLINKGSVCNDIKNYSLALQVLETSILLRSDIPEAWSNKGIALNNLNLYEESLSAYDKAIKLNYNYHEAWSNKGVTLHDLKRFDEAIAHFDKALSLRPDYYEAWSNKGASLYEFNRFDEAIAHYDKALSLRPDYPEAMWNKSLILLLLGDFRSGLPLYESRWESRQFKNASEIGRFNGGSAWIGVESLQGKSILLYGEQGFGDFIQFCRYVKLVSDLGAKVILEAPSQLVGLMKNLEGVSELVIQGDGLPSFDFHCSLLSLPLALGSNLETIPNASAYINLNHLPNKLSEWKERLGSKLKPRVGLVWSGSSSHKNDYNRSLLLADIISHLPSEFEYISLQKDIREVDKLTLDINPKILNFSGYLSDFVDTAALIDCLDFVISVDTSVAHLCGALGRKTLVLLPHVPDWRWLLDRSDSPWYPSMKLYRQRAIGDWTSVFNELKLDLSLIKII